MALKKAQRKASVFKGSIQGASGSGKTYSALRIMTELVALTNPGKGIAVVDTEKSAELYAPPFVFDVDGDFGDGLKASYESEKLIEKLETIRKDGGYGGVIVDSMTHFWKEAGGFTRMIDAICDAQKARGQKGDSFAAWKQVDPKYRTLMNYIRNYPLHIILCIRAKQAYERSEEKGKGSLKKVGMEPEFREGFEFEMDAQFAIDQDNVLVPLKHRLGSFIDGKTFRKPGKDVAECVVAWINEGAPGQETNEPSPATPPDPSNVTPISRPAPAEAPSASANPQVSVLDKMLLIIAGAKEKKDLLAARDEIKKAFQDKLLTDEQYKGILSPAYQKKKTELDGPANDQATAAAS